MPLPVPVLDDRDFGQLEAEGRSLIPRYSRTWTDHNPSDPGITLLELFAYVTETEMFQVDQVPPETIERFLDLLGSPGARGGSLDEAVAEALRALQRPERAITADEFESHALRIGASDVARAEYVVVDEPIFRERRKPPGRRVTWTHSDPAGRRITELGGIDETGRPWRASEPVVRSAVQAGAAYYVEEPVGDPVRLVVGRRGKTSYVKTEADGDRPNNLLALPDTPPPSDPAAELADTPPDDVIPHAEPLHPGEPAPVGMLLVVAADPAVRSDPESLRPRLDEIFRELVRRRLVTSRFHVAPPDFVRATVSAEVARRPGSGLATQTVQERVAQFLDPVHGGERGGGWPFGRSVYVSELFQVLEEMREVDHVVRLEVAAPDAPERQLPDVEHPNRIALRPMELVAADRVDIKIQVREV